MFYYLTFLPICDTINTVYGMGTTEVHLIQTTINIKPNHPRYKRIWVALNFYDRAGHPFIIYSLVNFAPHRKGERIC